MSSPSSQPYCQRKELSELKRNISDSESLFLQKRKELEESMRLLHEIRDDIDNPKAQIREIQRKECKNYVWSSKPSISHEKKPMVRKICRKQRKICNLIISEPQSLILDEDSNNVDRESLNTTHESKDILAKIENQSDGTSRRVRFVPQIAGVPVSHTRSHSQS